ncbi:MAG: SCP2 domain-containing protein [Halorhodospira sp.]
MLDALLNRLIHLDPDAHELLEPLAGRRVRLSVDGFPEIVVRFTTDGVILCGEQAEDEVDADLSASPEALRALLMEGGEAVGRFRIRGEVAVAQRLRDLLGGLQPDWEEPLTRALGDTVGHWSADTLRRMSHWLRKGAAQGGRDLGEWLTEESGMLVAPERNREFLDEGDQLRADSDRLAARVQRLERGRR